MWLLILLGIALIVWLATRAQKANRTLEAGPSPERIRATAAHPAQAPPRPSRAPGRWLSANEPIEIAGFNIPGGLIYVGGALPIAGGGRNENCLIDPTLAVARANADQSGVTMSYWPAYGSMSPNARRAYLEWLADGRRDPAAYIGYVFLFFYGLERRLFLDKALAETDLIVDEVQRLQKLYSANSSFASYSAALLQAAALTTEDTPPPALRPDMSRSYELPLDVRRHLGKRLAAREPLQSDEALLWLLSLPDTYLRTPATRCFNEFRALWDVRFAARFPKGFRVATPKTRLKAHYRAASGTFFVNLPIGDLPDIAAVSAPLKTLRDLATVCVEELGAYSRLLGRRPEMAGTAEAAALLPPELWNTKAGTALMKARQELEAHVKDEHIVALPMAALCSALQISIPDGDRVSAACERQICSILDRIDIAFEPDRRYGLAGLTPGGNVVLFRAEGGARVDADRADYVTARTIVEIGALAAVADKKVVAAEIESIQADLQSLDGLSKPERRRLLAYTAALLGDPPKQQSAFNRLAKLGELERKRVTQSAIDAVLADGHVTPSEVRFLEHLHKALGLPQDEVYAALHRGAVHVDEPMQILAEQNSAGAPIPAAAAHDSASIRINEERLARRRNETAEVSLLLAGIFVDDAPIPTHTAAPKTSSHFAGLDDAHATLLTDILVTGSVARPHFEDKARELHLLPEGAYETINEWGFEQFEEPILEDGDLICAVGHLYPELKIMGAIQ